MWEWVRRLFGSGDSSGPSAGPPGPVDGCNERLPPEFRAMLGGGDDLWVEARRADGTTWVVYRSQL